MLGQPSVTGDNRKKNPREKYSFTNDHRKKIPGSEKKILKSLDYSITHNHMQMLDVDIELQIGMI